MDSGKSYMSINSKDFSGTMCHKNYLKFKRVSMCSKTNYNIKLSYMIPGC